ncbi:Hypothetical protein FKW44_014172 [Caligus rogercresseyi]|uniref:Uncharacterized protein n=1 Tax=Caligus rogercresseyi TaxID=217165 RepID=A0A7T8GYH6_CALRO|nr:Hypothetical protein FKW44_014172 [Caligus rogercresseyi]
MKGNKALSKRLDSSKPTQQVGKEFKEDLAVADELLKLLDDFQKNSYSFSEMEAILRSGDGGRRKIPSQRVDSRLNPLS